MTDAAAGLVLLTLALAAFTFGLWLDASEGS